ncbi:hypothetical protein EHS39_33030 [Ensifer sp. MPMI2T]|nr:hypothetical protein EHS39_33030 [Ensifer sp. MPMI2T]
MSNKPAARRISKALPRGDKFAGQFALPGLVPDLVRVGDRIQLFDTEREAEIAALEACALLYDSRTIDTRKAGGYRRLSGSELAVALAELDVTVTYFAEIAGVPQHRALKWLDGEQDIPHSVHVLVKLLLMNAANFDMAARITRECQEE